MMRMTRGMNLNSRTSFGQECCGFGSATLVLALRVSRMPFVSGGGMAVFGCGFGCFLVLNLVH